MKQGLDFATLGVTTVALSRDLVRAAEAMETRASSDEFGATSLVVGGVCGTRKLEEVSATLGLAAAARRTKKLHELLQRTPGRGQLRRLNHSEHIGRVVIELAQSLLVTFDGLAYLLETLESRGLSAGADHAFATGAGRAEQPTAEQLAGGCTTEASEGVSEIVDAAVRLERAPLSDGGSDDDGYFSAAEEAVAAVEGEAEGEVERVTSPAAMGSAASVRGRRPPKFMRECIGVVLRKPVDPRRDRAPLSVHLDGQTTAALRARAAGAPGRRAARVEVGEILVSRLASAFAAKDDRRRLGVRGRVEAARAKHSKCARAGFLAAREAGRRAMAREARARAAAEVDVPSLFGPIMAARRFVWAAAADGVEVVEPEVG